MERQSWITKAVDTGGNIALQVWIWTALIGVLWGRESVISFGVNSGIVGWLLKVLAWSGDRAVSKKTIS